MFKPAQMAIGATVSSITVSSNVVVFDNNLYNRLVDVLGENGTDHTYLQLSAGIIREIVRVDNLDGGAATIARSRDGTEAAAFAPGTYVRYEFCSAAVTDMMAALPSTTVQLTAEAPVTVVENGPNDFTVGFESVQILSTNGTINVSGTFPQLDISVNTTTLGLCNTGIGGGDP